LILYLSFIIFYVFTHLKTVVSQFRRTIAARNNL